ncbi:AAA family ATPase [Endozoicomonas acroporae]|uniref:AAA family ATPase n=1 Tax=Endozoicomonas acroporae TaxID=1701104 RepID=UPI003D7B0847
MIVGILETYDNKPKPLPMKLPGLTENVIAGVIGQGGLGKSGLIHQIIMEASGFKNRLDFKGNQGILKTAYLPAEDPYQAIKHRLYHQLHSSGMTRDEIAVFAEYHHIDSLFDETPNIMDDHWIEYLHTYASIYDIIVIDTLRIFHRQNENDGSEMTQVVEAMKQIIKETKSSLVFVHHATKEASKNKDVADDQFACRGSSVIVDNSKWIMNLSPVSRVRYESEFNQLMKYENENNDYVSFKVTKKNFSKEDSTYLVKRVGSDIPDISGFHFERINYK